MENGVEKRLRMQVLRGENMKERVMMLLSVRPMTMFELLYDGGIGLVEYKCVKKVVNELIAEGKVKKVGRVYTALP